MAKTTKTGDDKEIMVQLTFRVQPGVPGDAEKIAGLLGLGTPRSTVLRAALSHGLSAFMKTPRSKLAALVTESL
jgi:hypothetical protein